MMSMSLLYSSYFVKLLTSCSMFIVAMAEKNLRKNTEVFLIGNYSPQIVGNKLPSNGQILKVLFFNMRQIKLSLDESARPAIRECLIFWEKARIPVRNFDKCVEKLKTLHEEWRSIQKGASKKTLTQSKNEQDFSNKMDDLFDIANADALSMITIEEDRQFLISQRQKGRVGYMYGIDKSLTIKEKRKSERIVNYENKKIKKTQESQQLAEVVELASSTSSGAEDGDSSDFSSIATAGPSPGTNLEPEEVRKISTPITRRGNKELLSERLVMALDKCKISDRNAVHILIATAEALGQDVSKLIINRSSIRRRRQNVRKKVAGELKEKFKGVDLNAAVVHWDGKLLPALTGNENVDRLPVIITSGNYEQILAVPPLENSTGREQAQSVFEILSDWGLENRVEACCFDTTASNTGRLNGACVLLELLLERRLLYLPCRHHIYELVVKSVFEIKLPGTSGPNVALFKRFKDSWSKIDKSKFSAGIDFDNIRSVFENDREEIINNLKNLLSKHHTRNDYKEFVELCLIFLGEMPKENYIFAPPGAMHHARWMAKVIYSLKIFLFRDDFKLTPREKTALEEICIFIVKIYVQAWFSAPLSIISPRTDFNFIEKLHMFKNIDQTINKTALEKFLRHLWYSSPEATALLGSY